MNTECRQTDVLIIGSGIAGCSAALALADAGYQVTLITKAVQAQEANTYTPRGGSSIVARWIRPISWPRISSARAQGSARPWRCAFSPRRAPFA